MPEAAREYLEVQVRTASKDQLLLLLLDGAVRFVEGALDKMEKGDREERCRLIVKAQNIVLELLQSLNPAIGDALYVKLVGLYKFIYRSLVEGNLHDDRAKVEAGLQILFDVRDTWRQAVAAYRQEMAPGAPAPAKDAAKTGISLSLQA
jgi:flagellar secretion chaperone FliS